MPTLLPTVLLLLLLLCTTTPAAAVRPILPGSSSYSLILSSCAHARYPSLCVRSLSPSSPRTSTDLAIASVAASLSSVHSAISSLRHLPNIPSPLPGPLRDCFQQLSDSADQLSKTKSELDSLRSETSRWQLDNACTWVSAALTNEDTCLDGVKGMDGSVKDVITGKVREVEKLTSNALYFVTHLAASRGRNNNNP